MFWYLYETISKNTIERIWQIVNEASPEDWWRENRNVEWRVSLPHDIFSEDPKTNLLVQNFVQPDRLYVQKLEPKASYGWHTDYARDTSITMCLNELEKSFTVWAAKKTQENPNHYFNVQPLYYIENGAYLIDGSEPHTGFNFSNNTRYLVSVSLTRPMNLAKAIEFLNLNLKL